MRKLIDEIKDLNGYVLGVGYLNNKIMKELDKNNNIGFDLLTNDTPLFTKKGSNNTKNNKKGKKVNIKKLKKLFKKHRPDHIICNVDDVVVYAKYFIKDSLYITNNSIYIYTDSKRIKLSEVIKRYKRYINSIEYNDEYIMINTTNYKNNIFKNIKYYIIDTLNAIYDYIGSIIAG